MEIIDNRALKLRVRRPERITSVIPKSKGVAEQDGIYDVLVHWGYDEVMVLKNLGIKNVPSPILKNPKWSGLYTPFDHQKDTASFLTMHRRAYCLNEQGTGKTNAILWAIDYLMNQGYINRALIICPLSIMKSTWQADAFKTITHRLIDVAHGNRMARAKIIESDASIVVINFDGVEIVLNSLVRGKFDLVVIDEANFVKNAKSKRWAAINSLIGPDTWLWMATGTPASQSPLDAYGLAKMMNPNGVPKFFGAFRDTVMNKITMFKYAPKPEATEYVHKLLQPAIRYTKEECMDLPEMLYTTREVPLTTQQAKYYKQLKEHMRIEAAGEEITTVNAAVNLNKLLQVSSGSAYTDDGEVLEFDASNRLTALEEIITESSHKVLVFANFRHGIDLISRHLTDKGITNDVIHGGVSANKRTAIFDKFQTTPDPHVLVIQPQSASHGVTLTAANTVVWWGPVTSYETYVQANARVHRAGQKNPSLVVHITGSPVENKLYSSLQAKEKMQDSLMSLYAEEVNS